MIYANPGQPDALVHFRKQYDNFIGGEWVAPVNGRYMDNISPVNGEVFCTVARSDAADIEVALDAAHAAASAWGKTPAAERSNALLRIADRITVLRDGARVACKDADSAVRISLIINRDRYGVVCMSWRFQHL